MTRWLITGGCGFIGRNLIRSLLENAEMKIRVVDDLSVGSRVELRAIHEFSECEAGDLSDARTDAGGESRIELFVGDVRDRKLAEIAVAGCDVVVHLAANTGVGPSIEDPGYDCAVNVIGTLNYLEACRKHGVKRFVFASSGATVGNCEPPLHEELPSHPVSPYGASKLAGEAYCSAYQKSFGIGTVALRFGNCYGPLSNHKGSVVAKFIREALAGVPWEIFGDGQQTRDFIFVDDIVDAIRRGATAENVGGEVFQIATSTETTVAELAEKLATILERRKISLKARQYLSPRIGDVQRNYSDTTKARRLLNWTSKVSLDEGLDRTVDWFCSGVPGAERPDR